MNTPASLDANSAEERVLGWQTKLHRWAGEDKEQRFGDLFNLVCDGACPVESRVPRNWHARFGGRAGETGRR